MHYKTIDLETTENDTPSRKQILSYAKSRLENHANVGPTTDTDFWLAEFIVTIRQSDIMVLDEHVSEYSKSRYTALIVSSINTS
jgi:hypothetical protein